MIATIKRLLITRRALQSDTIDSLLQHVIRLHAAKLAAEKRAESDINYWCEECLLANRKLFVVTRELDTIKRQRSDIVRRGNIAKRLKREAAASAEG